MALYDALETNDSTVKVLGHDPAHHGARLDCDRPQQSHDCLDLARHGAVNHTIGCQKQH
jgi:hypothetical protein